MGIQYSPSQFSQLNLAFEKPDITYFTKLDGGKIQCGLCESKVRQVQLVSLHAGLCSSCQVTVKGWDGAVWVDFYGQKIKVIKGV